MICGRDAEYHARLRRRPICLMRTFSEQPTSTAFSFCAHAHAGGSFDAGLHAIFKFMTNIDYHGDVHRMRDHDDFGLTHASAPHAHNATPTMADDVISLPHFPRHRITTTARFRRLYRRCRRRAA